MAALNQFTSGNVREAKVLVQLMVARNPQDAKALHLLGLILYRHGDLEEAAVRLRESVAADPSAVDALSDLAAVLRDLKLFEEALQTCMAAISLDTRFYRARTRGTWCFGKAGFGGICRDLGGFAARLGVGRPPKLKSNHMHSRLIEDDSYWVRLEIRAL